jgi:hypothetical protein
MWIEAVAGAILVCDLEAVHLVSLLLESLGLSHESLLPASERGDAHRARKSSTKSSSPPWGGVGAP